MEIGKRGVSAMDDDSKIVSGVFGLGCLTVILDFVLGIAFLAAVAWAIKHVN